MGQNNIKLGVNLLTGLKRSVGESMDYSGDTKKNA